MGQTPPTDPVGPLEPPPGPPPTPAGTIPPVGGPPAPPTRAPGWWVHPLERGLLVTAVVAVGILALIAIVLLVGEVTPDDSVARLLGAIAFVAIFSLTAAAALIPVRTRPALAWVGLVSSAVAFLLSLTLVFSTVPDQTLVQVFGVATALAWDVAFVALMLLAMGRHPVVDALGWGTIGLLALSFLLSLIQLFATIVSDGYTKVSIVIGILALFGLIATPAMARALAPRGTPGA